MSKNLLNKYVWLVETIYNAKYISFEEIHRRWLDDDISEGLEIPKRTFHTWINEAEELFGRSGDYSIFELRLCPEFDFQQEILSQTPEIEVLEPEWLREEIAGKIKALW